MYIIPPLSLHDCVWNRERSVCVCVCVYGGGGGIKARKRGSLISRLRLGDAKLTVFVRD